ncbi:cobalamin (5`-phosphate) synthase [Catenovulum agarivorans DS-2]|uniref:Adenosylcobinamide-GDP ribazoletransferase n=1 Tax=Catenovulum agarivorans DS-2 TaxID=1328313 RepID=W7QQR4_9ALTE|nr:adenosylcobinamide-GDP ribazoletransferase [Catenovulum agarivorans]EWH11337.1 cobalamin (5`-phosphate) synthase [Catenovulum agarivorans DS-2]
MYRSLCTQLNLFLLALSFFTRLPVTSWVEYSQQNLNKSNRYFCLVGWFIGGILAVCFVGLSQIFPTDVAVWCLLVISLLLTGVFHEDGLADMADGFGGGFSKADKLRIMKDSRLGTYGSSALMLALFAKLMLWQHLNELLVWLIPITYALSRATAAQLLTLVPYVSEQQSKSKPLAENQTSREQLINLACVLPVCLILTWQLLIALSVSILLFLLVYRVFLIKQIGGFTGDTLGGAQQISEILIYLVCVTFVHNQLAIFGGIIG